MILIYSISTYTQMKTNIKLQSSLCPFPYLILPTLFFTAACCLPSKGPNALLRCHVDTDIPDKRAETAKWRILPLPQQPSPSSAFEHENGKKQ